MEGIFQQQLMAHISSCKKKKPPKNPNKTKLIACFSVFRCDSNLCLFGFIFFLHPQLMDPWVPVEFKTMQNFVLQILLSSGMASCPQQCPLSYNWKRNPVPLSLPAWGWDAAAQPLGQVPKAVSNLMAGAVGCPLPCAAAAPCTPGKLSPTGRHRLSLCS